MKKELQLLTTKNFNGVKFDCYKDEQDSSDFWATREQIGRLLGYSNPRDSIKKIHKRNHKRLDKFSTVVRMATPKRGGQNDTPLENIQDVTVYNFKGLLEICRYSNQPNADAVIDKLWDIADEIRRTGMYLTDKAVEQLAQDPANFHRILSNYVKATKKNKQLQKELDANAPYTTLGKTVLALSGSLPFQSTAQVLAQKGVKIGQNRLFEWCRKNGLLCSRKGRQWNKPTQKAIEKGYLNLEIGNGFYLKTMVTPAGLLFLSNVFTAEQLPIIALIENEEAETEHN